MFISGDTSTESPQKRCKSIRTNLGGKLFMNYSMIADNVYHIYITIQMNLQNNQVMLDGQSSFLQGELADNPSNDSVTVPS